MTVAPRSDHLDYALRLHAELFAGGAPGLVWSPYSVATALGLVATGARGTTREELTGLLGADLPGHLAALDDAVTDGPELATTTGLWVRGDLPVESAFEGELRGRPNAAVHPADFAGSPEGVRAEVNAEVAKLTRGMITGLLRPGDVSARTRALLVNALWVYLRWSTPFEPERTAPGPFRTPAGERQVPMMRRTGSVPYAAAKGWRMVTLAGEHDLALDVLLPDEPTGGALTPDTLRRLYRAAKPAEVALALPRFELDWHAELSAPLGAAGVRTLFTDAADLSGVSAAPLRVDAVVHQARLRVDEKGAEGAAATAVVMRLASFVPQRPVVFTVDRPFTFVLRRRSAILFLGAVTDPEDPGPAADTAR
ncbi:serpin family protein [Marinitenerispora sediminis]|uniref:Proteinase inhibitor I4 serpin n=1 Tax=Marinitenerispora sediminis TaxID=1931232 RepID=A0A368T746_9ACTN|nr:serpin family protein [Marinitenerispora sediminis]RCV49480.1 proteinase inhibitor I4 serpin [Marinitenerispora sediminis]RCV57007.1 proteinase inhibitor I4 serpin [Marinitenerispora sediminis]RCV58645.1 proteinase inhibitor I4 serpin [Marinitenerispora sediminis]